MSCVVVGITVIELFWYKVQFVQYILRTQFFLLLFWTYSQLGRETEFERKSSDSSKTTVLSAGLRSVIPWATFFTSLCLRWLVCEVSTWATDTQWGVWQWSSWDKERDSAHHRARHLVEVQKMAVPSLWSVARPDKRRNGKLNENGKHCAYPAMGKTAGSFLLCTLCVSVVFKGHRRRLCS